MYISITIVSTIKYNADLKEQGCLKKGQCFSVGFSLNWSTSIMCHFAYLTTLGSSGGKHIHWNTVLQYNWKVKCHANFIGFAYFTSFRTCGCFFNFNPTPSIVHSVQLLFKLRLNQMWWVYKTGSIVTD